MPRPEEKDGGHCPKGSETGDYAGKHYFQERESVIFREADGTLFRLVECRKCGERKRGRKLTIVDSLRSVS